MNLSGLALSTSKAAAGPPDHAQRAIPLELADVMHIGNCASRIISDNSVCNAGQALADDARHTLLWLTVMIIWHQSHKVLTFGALLANITQHSDRNLQDAHMDSHRPLTHPQLNLHMQPHSASARFMCQSLKSPKHPIQLDAVQNDITNRPGHFP